MVSQLLIWGPREEPVMQKVNRALTAAAMVAVATVSVGVRAAEARQQEVQVDARHFDIDFDRWKPLVVLSAFVDPTNETVTLRGLNFSIRRTRRSRCAV